MKRRPAAGLAAAIVTFAVAGFASFAHAVQVPAGFTNDVIIGGLNEPNSFAFLPDGRVLVTEQHSGRVRLIVNGAIGSTDPVVTVPSLQTLGAERGLQGIAVDPAWPSRPYVYLAYTRTGDRFRIIRYTASGQLSDPNSGTLSLVTPLLLIDDIVDQTVYHQAGCLRFGPDGMLYVTLGDDANDCLAYDLGSLHGKLLRLKVDTLAPGGGGQVSRASITPADNPFVTDPSLNARLVWAWGLRNPWRFQIDRVTGTVYGCDPGDDSYEELNEIHAGDFLGWPYREGNLVRVRLDCPEPGGQGSLPSVQPIAVYAHGAEAYAIVSAGMYRPVNGGIHNWPESYYPDRGDVFYADYYAGELKRLTWTGASWVPAAPVPGQPSASSWATGLTTGVDYLVGPDGSLWWLRQYNDNFDPVSGSLNRIRSTASTGVEDARVAAGSLRVAPNPGRARTEFAFELARSGKVRLAVYDAHGRALRVLLEGPAGAGTTRASWDGRDAAGRRVSAGVYFARLEREGEAPVTARTLRLP